jgi:hypothetical protein
MTTQKKADHRAEELGSGKAGTSNAGGTGAGPGTMPSAEPKHDNQRTDAGAGSAKAANGRPGHKS